MGKSVTFVGCLIYMFLACSSAQELQKIHRIQASISQSEAMPGDNITISCHVEGLEAGDFVYLLKEVIGPSGPVVETVATNTKFQVPYSSRTRYTADFIDNNGTHLYHWNIMDAKKEDSGSYECSSPDYEKIDMVHLTVFEPINEIFFFNYTNSSDVIHLREGETTDIICMSNGTTSKPEMFMFLGENDISKDSLTIRKDHINLICGDSQGSGKTCLIHATFLSEMKVEKMRPTYQSDGQMLTCQSSIQRDGNTLDSKTASLKLNMTYEPHIECQPQYELLLDGVNAEVRCKVFANPGLNTSTISVSWTEGNDNIILLADESHMGIHMNLEMTTEREHTLTLTFDQVKKLHFHKYMINAENDLGETDLSFNVKEKIKDPDTGGSTGGGQIMTSSRVMGVVMMLFTIKMFH